MKNEMEEIDKLIKETLTEDEARFYDQLDEQGVFEMLGGLFKGKHSWWIIMINIVSLAALAGAIYCTVRFFNTDVTNELITWGIAGWMCIMIITMLKLFTWMQMDKQAILRELKRVELQISILAGKRSK